MLRFMQSCLRFTVGLRSHLHYPGARGFFFSLGATELSGEAAKTSREVASKKKTSGTNG